MRKVHLILFWLAAASLLLAACSGGQASEPTATSQPTAAPTAAATAEGEVVDANFTCEPYQILPDPRPLDSTGLRTVSADDHSAGPDDATLTIIEYSDFQCPYCALAAGEIATVMEKYPDDVRVVFRQFPLETHDKALLSAQASEAADLQGKFFEMHDAIFGAARTQLWYEYSLEEYETWLGEQAETIGLDAAKFSQDLDSQAVKDAVQADLTEGTTLGLSGTPSLFYLTGEDQVLFTADQQVSYDAKTLEAILKLSQMKTFDACPEEVIDPAEEYTALLKTEKGDITIKLRPDVAPLAVNSFVFLAQNDYYDNVSFHRVLEGFMAQGGDPTGTGLGGPGYRYKNEVSEELTFDREGLLAMANAGENSNGSQFFITTAPVERLNGGYTIFGEVTEGMDVVRALTLRDPDSEAPQPEGDKILDVVINP